MKNQFFGDFGDYQKASLLKLLNQEYPTFKILVHFMRTPDDNSTDGKHISYLNKSDYRAFDTDIYDYFHHHLIKKNTRKLDLFKNITGLEHVEFLEHDITHKDNRLSCHDFIIKSPHNVVLFDPDNGIEVSSTNKKNAQKFVFFSEIKEVYEAGKTVIIYQHFPRQNRAKYIQERMEKIYSELNVKPLALQVKFSVYFFIPQAKHRKLVENLLKAYHEVWGEMGVVHKFL